MSKRFLCVCLLVWLWVPGCATTRLHPGALNKADSVAYDSLLITQAVIEHGRTEFTAGSLSPDLKPAFNRLVESYNLARAAWLTYRSTVKAGGNGDMAPMQRAVDALILALNDFQKQRSIP